MTSSSGSSARRSRPRSRFDFNGLKAFILDQKTATRVRLPKRIPGITTEQIREAMDSGGMFGYGVTELIAEHFPHELMNRGSVLRSDKRTVPQVPTPALLGMKHFEENGYRINADLAYELANHVDFGEHFPAVKQAMLKAKRLMEATCAVDFIKRSETMELTTPEMLEYLRLKYDLSAVNLAAQAARATRAFWTVDVVNGTKTEVPKQYFVSNANGLEVCNFRYRDIPFETVFNNPLDYLSWVLRDDFFGGS